MYDLSLHKSDSSCLKIVLEPVIRGAYSAGASVEICSGRYSASVNDDFPYWSLQSFEESLVNLYGNLSGSAELSSDGGWVILRLSGDGKGHINLKGEISDHVDHHLTFAFMIDQSYLPPVIHNLRRVLDDLGRRTR